VTVTLDKAVSTPAFDVLKPVIEEAPMLTLVACA
jgi:hypothetical protein